MTNNDAVKQAKALLFEYTVSGDKKLLAQAAWHIVYAYTGDKERAEDAIQRLETVNWAGTMDGHAALEALKAGKTVRAKRWTPGNVLEPVRYEEVGELDVVPKGGELFLHDCNTFPGWLVAELATSEWEVEK
jgi:hypothetical protein